jgi:hypothetical protein
VAPGSTASALRYAQRTYDSDYGAFVTNERIQSNRAGQTTAYLEVEAEWDAGLGALVQLKDFNSQSSLVSYDRLGRQVALYRPLCQEPSVVYEFNLDPAGSLHKVHTLTNEVCDTEGDPVDEGVAELSTATGVMEAYAVVDGMGRVRATFAEGDPLDGYCWVMGGLAEYDARGNAALACHPEPIGSNCDNPLDSLVLTCPGLFAMSEYDAFGRVRFVTGPDGAETETRYGTRSTTVWDPNDRDGPAEHQATPATSVVDGLGRTVLVLSGAVQNAPGWAVEMPPGPGMSEKV